MSSHVVYACHCLNIRIHVSSKLTLDSLDEVKQKHKVTDPFPGWEFELGMGGVITEYSALTQTTKKSDYYITACLNCHMDVYSLQGNHVIIHQCGQAYEDVKQDTDYSKAFHIKLQDTPNLISMPASEQDVPDELLDTHKKMHALLDKSIEQLRLETQARIEQFKIEQEKKLQQSIAQVKMENNKLWSSIAHVSQKQEPNREEHHVHFAEKKENEPSAKRLSFALDEHSINRLRHMNLDNQDFTSRLEKHPMEIHDNEEEEEDMFNLDEELSEAEEEVEAEEEEKEKDEEEKEDSLDKKENPLLSASLKKSISEIDQKFSWIKKKRNTGKYLAQDFDIKSDFRSNHQDNQEDTSKRNKMKSKYIHRVIAVSMFATSVPITIHYAIDEPEQEKEDSYKKKDILVSSFANFDASERLLSAQFPAPRRRKSVASASLLRPQLESLVGKSLDTRGVNRKKKDEEEHHSDDEFDSTMPPHVWAALNSVEDE
ncbi:hypothetical protein CU098_007969 [Rhizopus stolonifer]|uniref:Uncharacterized protein n=1 Tax=Rhizopus stolonifer TaxID=4846 RepID=A0A367JCL3_RHIST|nr:hypothetical protein CU098_007969 [Rhizopus stolonifer]